MQVKSKNHFTAIRILAILATTTSSTRLLLETRYPELCKRPATRLTGHQEWTQICLPIVHGISYLYFLELEYASIISW